MVIESTPKSLWGRFLQAPAFICEISEKYYSEKMKEVYLKDLLTCV